MSRFDTSHSRDLISRYSHLSAGRRGLRCASLQELSAVVKKEAQVSEDILTTSSAFQEEPPGSIRKYHPILLSPPLPHSMGSAFRRVLPTFAPCVSFPSSLQACPRSSPRTPLPASPEPPEALGELPNIEVAIIQGTVQGKRFPWALWLWEPGSRVSGSQPCAKGISCDGVNSSSAALALVCSTPNPTSPCLSDHLAHGSRKGSGQLPSAYYRYLPSKSEAEDKVWLGEQPIN